jgi:hypothetical protein
LGADLEAVLSHLSRQLEALDTPSRGSRFAGQAASAKTVDHLASGGSLPTGRRGIPEEWRVVDGGGRRGDGLASTMVKALALRWLPRAPYVSRDVLMGLRARSVVLQMGVTRVDLRKSLNIVSLSTGASASYVAENALVPISEETFAEGPLLTPKELAAMVPISDRLLREADNPSVEEVVRRDLVEVLSLRADLAFLRGTGTGGEPRGIRNTLGLTPAPSLGPNGGPVVFDDLKDMVAALREQNAPFSQPGWVFAPRTINSLEKLKDSTGRYLSEAGLLTFDSTGSGGTHSSATRSRRRPRFPRT